MGSWLLFVKKGVSHLWISQLLVHVLFIFLKLENYQFVVVV